MSVTTTNGESETGMAPAAPERGSLLARARAGDESALRTIFRQYLPPEEPVLATRYLGTQGVWGLGTHSFGCVTGRRIASLRVARFGEVVYQDGDLAEMNSGALYQPSRLQLYLFVIVLSVLTVGLGLLLLPLTVRLFYRLKKSGLVVWIREGIPLHVFSDRKLVGVTNELYRTALAARAALVPPGQVRVEQRPLPLHTSS